MLPLTQALLNPRSIIVMRNRFATPLRPKGFQNLYFSAENIYKQIYMWEGLQVILSGKNVLKCVVEGMAVSLAMYLLTDRTRGYQEIMWVGLTAGLTFLVLDAMAPSVGAGARQGSGFGLGFKTVGMNLMGGGEEDFENPSGAGASDGSDDMGDFRDPTPVQETHHPLTTAPSHHEQEHPYEPVHPVSNPGYYVVPGSYSHRIVKPGYNQDLINPANIMNLYHHEEPAPLGTSAPTVSRTKN